MKCRILKNSKRHKGAALIIAMVFVLLFASLAVSLVSLTGTNAQIASNQHKVNSALYAAQSGLDCAKKIVSTVALDSTMFNTVTQAEADRAWDDFCFHLQTEYLDGQSVPDATSFTDAYGSGEEIITGAINFGSADTSFRLRFYRYTSGPNSDPFTIKAQAIGASGQVIRKIGLDMKIQKDASVLQYAVASRGRMWLTGDSTIHGDVYSSWDRTDISPFNMTSDSRVEGTINTILDYDAIESAGAFQLETLDADGNPMDTEGNPLGTNYEDRYYGPNDEIQAYHEGINYSQPDQDDIPGMDIADYDTDDYNPGTNIDLSSTIEVEYFPHAPSDEGGYSWPRDGTPGDTWNRELDRHVYENTTFNNVRLPDNRNALFRNCTFEGVLYIDCYKSGSNYYNNVRFEDCTFNGTIVTDVPQVFKWQHNCLYFTGAATFNNNSGYQEATILAPHFNVNLGNTNPDAGENNVLTGAIVGGIVDVRGNAEIYGTIISMCDTTGWSSGYVTNIGATLGDGGSETTEPGDVGTIEITPDPDNMLPSGISSPIVIKPLTNTYSEGV
ncbi:MAG: pilus assembly PilX N-terminal domain-containing protein [Sedimentisphaerales bacterium]|nr:pilus assembly PilX N-terminal domain-containing protein [Sedimentisphaerales bacterium]